VVTDGALTRAFRSHNLKARAPTQYPASLHWCIPGVRPSFLPFGERGDEFLQKSGMSGSQSGRLPQCTTRNVRWVTPGTSTLVRSSSIGSIPK